MSDNFLAQWAQGPAKATRWGHSAPTILTAVIGASVLLALRPTAYDATLRPLISLALLGLMIATMVEMRRHDRALCEWCAADMPLNPAQRAQSLARRLAFVHLISERKAGRNYLLAVLVACLLPLFAPASLRIPVMTVAILASASVIYLVLSQVTHRRLQPWCPQCGDQGGQDAETPTPLPIDSLSG